MSRTASPASTPTPTSTPSTSTESRVDDLTEWLTRWTAARSTRRSFLHRIGQLAVLVAAGPTIAGLLIREAQARVCGQSGVTPKCDTFDCVGPGDVWGWCWYASDGCCRNDGLKKICDCCTVDYPNVHGYCPSGTNVRCIVESCGKDPRVLNVALTPVAWSAGVGYHHAAIRAGHPLANRAVVADADDRWMQYLAAPLAGALGAPLLAVGSTGPTADDLALLTGLGVSEVLAVGPINGAGAFTGASISIDQVTSGTDHTTLSQQVADRIIKINDIDRTVTLATTGLSAEAAPLGAAFAALGGFPVMIGSAATAAVGSPTLYIGPEPAEVAVPGDRTQAGALIDLSIELTNLAASLPHVSPNRIALAPAGSSDVIGLTNLGVPIVLHPLDRLGPIEGWIQDHSLRWGELQAIHYTQGPGQLTTQEYWRLQGTANGFRVDQLQGVAGQGLPVIRQPLAERPLGMARTDGAYDWGSVEPPNYWTTQGQTFRR